MAFSLEVPVSVFQVIVPTETELDCEVLIQILLIMKLIISQLKQYTSHIVIIPTFISIFTIKSNLLNLLLQSSSHLPESL